MYQLSKNELRETKPLRTEFGNLKRFPIVCVLENLSNMHNIGVIIRTCEAFRVEKLIVYSKVDILKSRKVLKSSLSAWRWLPIEQTLDMQKSLRELKLNGYKIVAVELTNSAKEYAKIEQFEKRAFIFGNEKSGVSKEALDMSDSSVYIPMHGMANSINVSSALSIIVAQAVNEIRKKNVKIS